MSDLLAPLLFVMDNEVDAFWCFVGYMNMVVSGCGKGCGCSGCGIDDVFPPVQHKYFEKSQERTKDRLKILRLMLSVQEQDLYDHFSEWRSGVCGYGVVCVCLEDWGVCVWRIGVCGYGVVCVCLEEWGVCVCTCAQYVL